MATEIQRLKDFYDCGNALYIKRDDLLSFSMGGNKVRIAGAFYEDMQKKHCNAMIIYGSRHSNLCRVLSNLCCSRGIECVMICSHEEQEDAAATFNTWLIDWTGTSIVHCGKSEIAAAVERVMDDLKKKGKKPYYIYGDKFGQGNEGTAVAAYVGAYQEILDFEKEQGWEFDYIFCPSGTGATQSGLTCGHLMNGDRKKVIGILISSRDTERALQVIETGIADYYKKNGLSAPDNMKEEIRLLDQYRQEGYGKYDSRITDLIRSQYLTNSIPLDPVYTGKAFWGMTEYIRENGISGSRILFLHTGGTPLFYDYLLSVSGSKKG